MKAYNLMDIFCIQGGGLDSRKNRVYMIIEMSLLITIGKKKSTDSSSLLASYVRLPIMQGFPAIRKPISTFFKTMYWVAVERYGRKRKRRGRPLTSTAMHVCMADLT